MSEQMRENLPNRLISYIPQAPSEYAEIILNANRLWNPEVDGGLPPTDALAVLGRGVEIAGKTFDSSGNLTGTEWAPTRYVQEMSKPDAEGYRLAERAFPEGWEEFNYWDPAESEKYLAAKGQSLMVGGGKANTMAIAAIYEEWWLQGYNPKLIVWSAGSPFYLKDRIANGVPGTPNSEAQVMMPVFKHALKSAGVDTSTLPEQVIKDKNKNTEDDVRTALEDALERGLTSVCIVNTTVAMPRTMTFYNKIISERQDLAHLSVIFATSENILLNYHYGNNPNARERYLQILERVERSDAWRNTTAKELSGIEAILASTYTGKGNY